MAQKHVCGACSSEFDSEQEYCEHVCETTGHQANTLEHQDAVTDGQASRASAAALARGAKKSKKDDEEK